MELRHLRYFVAAAEELNFRRAAERLHISQPPLSLQIAQLEGEIGARLFDRTRQGVVLTAAGRTFLEHARQVLELADLARRTAAQAARGEAGELRVAFTPSVKFISSFTASLRTFRERNPGVDLKLTELDSVNQINAIARGAIDLGVLPRPASTVPSLVSLRTFMPERMVLATYDRSPLSRLRKIHVPDLLNQPLVCTPRHSGHGLHWHLAQSCWSHGFVPDIVSESTSLPTLIALVASGLGSAVLPESLQSVHLQGVVWRPFADAELAIDVCVASHGSREHRLADRLSALLLKPGMPAG